MNMIGCNCERLQAQFNGKQGESYRKRKERRVARQAARNKIDSENPTFADMLQIKLVVRLSAIAIAFPVGGFLIGTVGAAMWGEGLVFLGYAVMIASIPTLIIDDLLFVSRAYANPQKTIRRNQRLYDAKKRLSKAMDEREVEKSKKRCEKKEQWSEQVHDKMADKDTSFLLFAYRRQLLKRNIFGIFVAVLELAAFALLELSNADGSMVVPLLLLSALMIVQLSLLLGWNVWFPDFCTKELRHELYLRHVYHTDSFCGLMGAFEE